MMKKAITAVITAAAMFSTAAAFAAEDTENNVPEYEFNSELCKQHTPVEMMSFKDMAELPCEVDVLVRLGIIAGYDDGELKLDREITRGEAAKMLYYILYDEESGSWVEDTYSEEKFEQKEQDYLNAGTEYEYDGFSDVDWSSWYHPYVYYMKLNNVTDGYEDGTFRPENSITEIELLAMLERMIGYSYMIEAEGGYPDGVTVINERLGLIDEPENVPATRARAVEMFYNALDVYIVMIDGMSFNENGMIESHYVMYETVSEYRGYIKVHGTLKGSDQMEDKTILFVPDEDFLKGNIFTNIKIISGKEYIFAKKYSDMTAGEASVYINTKGDYFTIAAAEYD